MQITHDTMAQVVTNLNSDNLPMYHLRRIGPPSTKQGIADVMDFYQVTYRIGQKDNQVDFVIDSCNTVQNSFSSQCYAHIIRQSKNEHELYDDSLTGVFINNTKISGSCILQNGDMVIFGHPAGARLQPGSREQQLNSEHQFLFEVCSCDRRLTPQNSKDAVKQEQHSMGGDGDISSNKTPLKRNYETEVDSPKKQKIENDAMGNMTMVNKAKDFLEKFREKKSKNVSSLVDSNDLLNCNSPAPSSSVSNQHSDNTKAQIMLEYVKKHVNSCDTLISLLISMFDERQDLKDIARVIAWRLEIEEIKKKLVLPKTVIAVVGDTGSGKSSLMNALLDRKNVLPTSGMRACTAVVVKVEENTLGSQMEADIVFLQKEEWFDDLQFLLNDLTGGDGTLKNIPPDHPDAYASYCKVKAVYGRVDKFEVLERQTTVTQWLGEPKVIESSDLEGFGREVAKYIETQEPENGDQYWPIVKYVQLRIPNCDVCSSGAVLVDLPGTRDSNAAREKIAQEHLKNCTAVWVVSGIQRAIDDKTAKDLLKPSFRQQLLMDGLYGSISFICTKTDDLKVSESIRCLKLDKQTRVHEEQVNEMERQKADHDSCVNHCNKQLKTLQQSLNSQEKEVSDFKQNVAVFESQLDSVDVNSEKILEELKEELRKSLKQMSETEMQREEMIKKKDAASQKIYELEQQLNFHRRAIRSICAKARNEYSKSQITRDFKAGLKEIKRHSGMLPDVDEEDACGDDTDDDSNTADNLRVFCCSAVEYQKLKNHVTNDGPAQVFSNDEDTQIPDLRNYVHEITSVRYQQAMERLIRSLGRYLFGIKMYLSGESCSTSDSSSRTKAAIVVELTKLEVSLDKVLQQMSSDVVHVFDHCIRPMLQEGASNAASEANQTCAKWGSLNFNTYRATCRRNGVFCTAANELVDFNMELAQPMYLSMTVAWDKAFSGNSGQMWKILDNVKNGILAGLKECTMLLGVQLEAFGIARNRSAAVSDQVMRSATNKLSEMVDNVKEIITNKQREISRIVTPHVRACLNAVYSQCSMERGEGMFVRMKNHMQHEVNERCSIMFDEAMEHLMRALMDLQRDVLQIVRTEYQSLILDLQAAFEPLWDDILALRSAFLASIVRACDNVRRIYEAAGLENTEETTIAQVSLSAEITPGSTSAAATCTGSNQA